MQEFVKFAIIYNFTVMKRFLVIFLMIAFAACKGDNSEVCLIPSENFKGDIDGKKVSLYTVRAGQIVMQVTNFGARVVSLWTPDKDGNYEDIVLGYDTLDKYVNNKGERFLGSAVGTYANRIADGRFELDGTEYILPKNNNGQTLHGGMKGLDMVVWDVISQTDSSLVMQYVHPDGLDGFPGNIDIIMTYSLNSSNEFSVKYEARTDKPTVLNLSHHSFFNLKGEGKGTILDNLMCINASRYIPIDSVSIPTGEIADVESTPFDFRKRHAIGDMIEDSHIQLKNGSGYDHNWVLDRKTAGQLEFAASVYEPSTGRTLEVYTDQPGLQFYCGNFFDGTTEGKYGRPLRFRESIALETQKFPDSPNNPQFPSTRLDPDDVYTHICIYRFGVK